MFNCDKVIKIIDELLTKKDNLVIAIEGGSGSGKSTLANHLQKHYNCNIIHTDDFFLPVKLRTDKRYLQAGGNVHYERLKTVCKKLKHSKTFKYKVFNCQLLKYKGEITINPQNLTIIEGVYSMHPLLEIDYDFTIFLNLDYQKRCERILQRNGEEMLQVFIDNWIPLEDKYFNEFKIMSNCNEIINEY